MALLLSIMNSVWFIEPNAARAYKPVVDALLSGKQQDFAALMPVSKNLHSWVSNQSANANIVTPHPTYGFKGVTTKNSIALIPLTGVVMKYDFCGDQGTKTLSALFQQAATNDAFIGIILIADSPGGEVSGTQIFAELLSSIKLSKPVITFVEGMACSAAYWIGSSTSEIIASTATDIVGSIGTYFTMRDYTKMYENDGVVEHSIYATKSTEKNLVYKKVLEGDYEPIRQSMIDPINEGFLSAVRKNRYGKGMNYKKAFTGRTYLASEAVNDGLIDAIGNFDYAISRIQKLAA
jgi:signal peptide peptidase SppA